MSHSSIRTRYAPSPTGRQHIGGVRTALFNFLYARANHGSFLLRLEDTDRTRYQPEAEDDMVHSLRWMGIEWDEGYQQGGPHGPYRQSERVDIYQQYAEELISRGAAYRAYDPPEELAELRNAGQGYDRRGAQRSEADNQRLAAQGVQPVIRLHTPPTEMLHFNDLILGTIARDTADLAVDPVLLKSDGFPTYHLASVVDDHLMAITHVLRAQEWLSSTGIHLLLYRALSWEPPLFAHLPPIVDHDGKKLSKRHGAISVLDMRAQGYLPQALINYIALLGWAFDDKRERFSLPELIELFSLEGIQRAPARFDVRKLDWHNRNYIQALPIEEFTQLLYPIFEAQEHLSPVRREQIKQAAALIQPRIATLQEAPQWLNFCKPEVPQVRARANLLKGLSGASEAIAMLRNTQERLPQIYTDSQIETTLRNIAQEQGYHNGKFMALLRYTLSGSAVSLPMSALFDLLTIAEVRDRLKQAIAQLEKRV